MTALPPEPNEQPEAASVPPQPEAPAHWNAETPLESAQAATDAALGVATEAAEAAAPAAAPASAAPEAPVFEAPAAPVPPAYAAPPAYGAPAAPAAGGYAPPAAPPGGFQAPPAAPQQQGADPVGNLQLNYWLSVFFAWLPALIFWLIDKDKGNERLRQFDVANLNFSILRTLAAIAASILSNIEPITGILLSFVVWGGGLVLHILAAVKVGESYRNGDKTDPFIFNVKLVK